MEMQSSGVLLVCCKDWFARLRWLRRPYDAFGDGDRTLAAAVVAIAAVVAGFATLTKASFAVD